MVMSNRVERGPQTSKLRRWAPPVLALGLLNVGKLYLQDYDGLSTPQSTQPPRLKNDIPCDTKVAEPLQQTADRAVESWRKKGVNLLDVQVVYVPEMPKDGCSTLVGNKWKHVHGSQSLGGGTIVVTDISKQNTTTAERNLIVNHEIGHYVQDVRGQKYLRNMEPIADCSAGASSQDIDRAGIDEYLDALDHAPNGGWHGSAGQRQAYLLQGYQHDNCDPAILEDIERHTAQDDPLSTYPMPR
jgi:hypothetical protein